MEKIRIIIADDHKMVLEAITSLFQAENDFEVLGASWDGEGAVQLAKDLKPDIALLDFIMPKMNGIVAARKIKVVSPDTVVFILSFHEGEPYRKMAFDAGTAGFISKSTPFEDIAEMIKMVVKRNDDISNFELVMF